MYGFASFSECSLHILKTIKSLQRIIVHSQWRAPRADNTARLLEAVGLGLFTIAAIFFLSYTFGECVDVPAWHEQVWYISRPVKMHTPLNDLPHYPVCILNLTIKPALQGFGFTFHCTEGRDGNSLSFMRVFHPCNHYAFV